MDKEIAALESLVEELGTEHVDSVDTASFNVESLFEGEEFSPEFKEKIATVFYAALKAQVNEEVAVITASLTESTEMEIESAAKGMKSLVDGYLDVLAEKWLGENEIALGQSLRAELFESMLGGMKDLLESHNIVVPEGKVDALKEMEDRCDEASAKANELMEEVVQLRKSLKAVEMGKIVEDLTEGLSDMQAEKFAVVAKDYMDESDIVKFARKLHYIRESLFADTRHEEKQVTLSESVMDEIYEEVMDDVQFLEEAAPVSRVQVDPAVSAYARFLNKV